MWIRYSVLLYSIYMAFNNNSGKLTFNSHKSMIFYKHLGSGGDVINSLINH